MKDSKEIMLRQYLLGKFNEQEELEDAWSRELLFNDELSVMAEAIEDEIIEEYLDDTLDTGDRQAVEEYFMRPPERRNKLRFAILLRDHFARRTQNVAAMPSAGKEAVPEFTGITGKYAVLAWRPYFRTGIEVFAVLLMVASFFYLSNLRRGLQSQITESQKQEKQLADKLDQQTARADSLARRLQQLQPPVAILNLMTSGLRSTGASDKVEIKPWTENLRVDVALLDGSANAYDVRLETTAHQKIWEAANLPSAAQGRRLTFDMSPQGIKTGAYSLIVSSKPGSFRKMFTFRAVVAK